MQFKLIGGDTSFRKHDINTLKEVVYGLTDSEDSFIILEPKHSIDNSIYLQAVKQGEAYIAEIRFVFGNADNYKHYSKFFGSADSLFEVFLKYYLDAKIPDISAWNNETDQSVCIDVEMIKLYKTIDRIIHYFEVWLNDDAVSLTIHQGILGETGETEDIIYDEEGDLPVEVAMADIIANQETKGYAQVEQLVELIVQYPSNINKGKAIKQNVEALLNECLGWTGNGHCEGLDIASDTLNFFCYVVDKQIATKTILELLIEEGYFEGVKIGYADEITGEYQLLFPENGSFFLL